MNLHDLSVLDVKIIIELLKGNTDKEIANHLQVSEKLIEKHRKKTLNIITDKEI